MYAAGRFKHLFQYSIPTVLIFLIQKRSCSYVARMIMKYVQYDVWHVVDPKQKKTEPLCRNTESTIWWRFLAFNEPEGSKVQYDGDSSPLRSLKDRMTHQSYLEIIKTIFCHKLLYSKQKKSNFGFKIWILPCIFIQCSSS